MVTRTKIIYFFFLLWFFQSHPAAFAQEDAIKRLQNQFEQFSAGGLTEKLYVHTDKNFYNEGEISMKEGMGNGSFIIPASIASGNYLLRAYTNWMKNNDPAFFFEKTLTIINSLKKPDWASIEKTGDAYDVQFLPEGGQLVTGIESRIAFKAVDKNGKGINCKGYILDQKNDT